MGGANAAAEFESWNVSLEHKFPTRTYVGVLGEILNSKVRRVLGVFDMLPTSDVANAPFIFPSHTKEDLDYQERSISFTLNQLAAQEWAFGAAYGLSQAALRGQFPSMPASAEVVSGFPLSRDWQATLQQVNLHAIYSHPYGFYAETQALWMHQRNDGYASPMPGDDFWQFNAFVGYRFPRRQAELRLGLLNITDQDYRLNPLNLVAELPRQRTLLATRPDQDELIQLDSIINKACEQQVSRRYQSAAEMKDDLLRLQHQLRAQKSG